MCFAHLFDARGVCYQQTLRCQNGHRVRDKQKQESLVAKTRAPRTVLVKDWDILTGRQVCVLTIGSLSVTCSGVGDMDAESQRRCNHSCRNGHLQRLYIFSNLYLYILLYFILSLISALACCRIYMQHYIQIEEQTSLLLSVQQKGKIKS